MADRVLVADEIIVAMPRPVIDPVPSQLPHLFRVQSIERLPMPSGRAALFHDAASLKVEWLSRQTDIRIVQGCLVSIRWQGNPVSIDGHVRIGRLVLMERSEPEADLFQTVPYGWVRDRELLQRASDRWEGGPAIQHGSCGQAKADSTASSPMSLG